MSYVSLPFCEKCSQPGVKCSPFGCYDYLSESVRESGQLQKERREAFRRDWVIEDAKAAKRYARIERRAARRAAALLAYQQLMLLPLPMPKCDELPEFLRLR